MYRIIFKKRAKKHFDALTKKDRLRIVAALQTLKTEPFSGKKLKRQYAGYWSLRVWPYRIIYSINKKNITVTIMAIGNRKSVYRS